MNAEIEEVIHEIERASEGEHWCSKNNCVINLAIPVIYEIINDSLLVENLAKIIFDIQSLQKEIDKAGVIFAYNSSVALDDNEKLFLKILKKAKSKTIPAIKCWVSLAENSKIFQDRNNRKILLDLIFMLSMMRVAVERIDEFRGFEQKGELAKNAIHN